MSAADDGLLNALAALVGDRHVIAPDGDQEPYVVDWRGRYRGRARAVVTPGSTQEVAAVVRLCARQGIAITPQGGNTGMCGAAMPDGGDRNIVIRLDRMRNIRKVNPLADTNNPRDLSRDAILEIYRAAF